MNNESNFTIDNILKTISIENSPEIMCGKDETLSSKDTDITFNQPWYNKGFDEIDIFEQKEFSELRTGLIKSIGKIVKEECNIENLEDFNLENYHEYVKSDKEHFKIVSRTRDLFSEDFNFPVKEVIPKFEKSLGFDLTDINPKTGNKLHIIVRINRPKSNDYNPPHKDIYENFDNDSYIPQFVNFWIPIAGVNSKSNLPLAPKSHLINENKICRTFEGGLMQGNKYRVRMVKSWNGKSDLIRSTVKYGQVLIFSGHLIHGLAINDNSDKTRVALEFRLFKA